VSVDEWSLAGIFEGGQAKVYIQARPMDVEIVQKFHIEDVRDSSFFEPRIFLVGQEVLLAPHVKPESVAVDVQDFNL
jgi:hypothetical protein